MIAVPSIPDPSVSVGRAERASFLPYRYLFQ
jgi:hypothetical protein